MRIVLGQQRDENKQTKKAFLTWGEESIPEAGACMEREPESSPGAQE